jgi:RNA binding activity-knot of a chromodomain
VVERSPDKRRYKVHYPGWESRWDEWVPRERLRWGNDARAAKLKQEPITVGDTVEIWCGGVNVPGKQSNKPTSDCQSTSCCMALHQVLYQQTAVTHCSSTVLDRAYELEQH